MATDASPVVRYRRSYLEAQARHALHSPAVRALALLLWLLSAAVSTYLLVQSVNHLEWMRDYSMKVIVVSFAAAFQNRFLYGFVLPFVAGGTWLASLLVLAKYYEAYGLHTRWWRPWTAATPFRELSPGSGAAVLIGRFLFVLGIQGCTGVAVLAFQTGLLRSPAAGYGLLLAVVAAYGAVGTAAFAAAFRVRARIAKALADREAAFGRGDFVGRPPGIR
ncbi:MAG: hypothetical protein OXJ90_11225 [Spirochaetaceae bacterium]|nr:hypothetical protein [Spirochaetaceae bacterium]